MIIFIIIFCALISYLQYIVIILILFISWSLFCLIWLCSLCYSLHYFFICIILSLFCHYCIMLSLLINFIILPVCIFYYLHYIAICDYVQNLVIILPLFDYFHYFILCIYLLFALYGHYCVIIQLIAWFCHSSISFIILFFALTYYLHYIVKLWLFSLFYPLHYYLHHMVIIWLFSLARHYFVIIFII